MSTSPSKPLFTVIIPTKDRSDYMYHTLRTCSLQDYENLEIIVSDDGSTDNLKEIVEEAARKDPRIRYVSPGNGESVGMRDNFEFALDQVKPGYVLALGGDDALLPYGISRMWEILEATGQEILTWPAPAYFYPKTKMETGQLIVHAKYGRIKKGTRIIKSKQFLERQAKNLSYVSDIESPMFYVKSVVSTRLVDKVRSRSSDGRFYACSTPDGYSGIVLAGEVETYAFTENPFSMHGVSPTSQGVGYLSDTKEANSRSEDFFKKAKNIPMHRELATQEYSPLITVMTADYLLTARDLPGWPGIFPPIDFKQLLTQSISELSDNLFAYDKVSRELGILHRIAKYHGLEDFFKSKVRSAHRNKRNTLEGNAISAGRIYLDANQFNIHNVYDAVYVANYIHQIIPKLTFSTLLGFIKNSIKYGLSGKSKGAALPNEEAWL
ncbi:glycosyltransferase family 2 protein [Pedobacter heparinus]|uniref:glycosyltransferase family 2 protein n=1 Tax=Pedobacter heparinus TaxID=984 RepID=UPI00292E5415|nr:glycosyltransferase family 2 protein [Pedobacter heparinus]